MANPTIKEALERFRRWKTGQMPFYPGGLHGTEIFLDLFVLADAYEELKVDEQKKHPTLEEALKNLFSLPNWENRSGPWNDINQAMRDLHYAYTHPPTPRSKEFNEAITDFIATEQP